MNSNRISHKDISMQHSLDIQIRFGDYDTFGHINNNSYMTYLDLGKSEFLCRLMGKRCTPSDLSAAIVNINVDFLAPTVVGEPLCVQTAVIHLGEKSFTLYQRLLNPSTGQIKVQATSVLAGFNIATQSAATLRQDLVENLRSLVSKL